MEDKWLDDIKKKLSDYEKEVPGGLWEAVNPSVKRGIARGGSGHCLRLYRYAAVVAVMVILGGFVAHLWHEDRNMDLSAYVSQNDRPESKRAEASGKIQKVAQVTKKVMPAIHNELANNKPEESEESLYEKENGELVHDDNDCNGNSNGKETAPEDNENDEDGNEIKLSLFRGGADEVGRVSGRNIMNKVSNKTYPDNFSVGVMTSMGTYGQNSYYGSNGGNNMGNGVTPPNPNDPSVDDPGNSNSPGDELLPPTPPGDIDSNNPGNDSNSDDENNDPDNDKGYEGKRLPWKNAPSSGMDESTQSGEEYTHHIPVKFGITFLYQFSKRVGVETGLVYTYLSSDVKYTTEGNSMYSHGDQSLHYLGIPLSVKYRPLCWKWFNVYLSGGVEFDKCLTGSVKRYYATPSPMVSAVREFSLKERPFQISLNASVGFQVNLSDFLGIYVEPGLSYYFKDGSSINTIYKEHPCDFNLNAGVRFTLGGR